MSEVKLCEWCGQRPATKHGKQMFCGTSCSAKWRMARPEIRAKVHNDGVHAKISATHFAHPRPDLAKASSDRMKTNNPMSRLDIREKVRQALKGMGHHPPVQGGNGRPLSRAHAHLAALLPDLTIEWPMPTGRGGGHHYMIDLADPELKIAIEIDGASHLSLARRKVDREKDAFLSLQGWLVLRVSNDEVLTWDEAKAASTISRLRDQQHTSSRAAS